MGRALTKATLESLEDLWAARRGLIADDEVRRITVDDALVDTGATLLSLPGRLNRELGLEWVGSRPVLTSSGKAEAGI